ncbi:VTT domain-containing protein [candidate division WWE3 bacterium]|nr:VTT domain-containing protein [candidate division WWE3 bacterium]
MLTHIRRNQTLLIFIIGSIGTIAAYVLFVQSTYFIIFTTWAKDHPIILFFALVSVKILSIIWPPLSGSMLLIGMIPAIGWPSIYLIDFVGSIIGSSVSYFIGEKYGITFLKKLFDDVTIEKIQSIHLIPTREIEAIFILRVLSGGVFFEAVCYGAGIIGAKFSHFFIANVLFHLTVGIPMFYLFGNIMIGSNRYLSIGLLIGMGLLIYRLRKRYFIVKPRIAAQDVTTSSRNPKR